MSLTPPLLLCTENTTANTESAENWRGENLIWKKYTMDSCAACRRETFCLRQHNIPWYHKYTRKAKACPHTCLCPIIYGRSSPPNYDSWVVKADFSLQTQTMPSWASTHFKDMRSRQRGSGALPCSSYSCWPSCLKCFKRDLTSATIDVKFREPGLIADT